MILGPVAGSTAYRALCVHNQGDATSSSNAPLLDRCLLAFGSKTHTAGSHALALPTPSCPQELLCPWPAKGLLVCQGVGRAAGHLQHGRGDARLGRERALNGTEARMRVPVVATADGTSVASGSMGQSPYAWRFLHANPGAVRKCVSACEHTGAHIGML